MHCCGFDSIPSDLGTCLVVDHLNRLGKYVQRQLFAAVFSVCSHQCLQLSKQRITLTLTLLTGFLFEHAMKCHVHTGSHKLNMPVLCKHPHSLAKSLIGMHALSDTVDLLMPSP